jgi:putative FmdB family regulatory protein
MAVYEYTCDECGRFDIRLTIGTAPAAYRCPQCARTARRVFSPPMLGQQVPKPLGALLDREEQSRDAPDVVTRVPPRRVRRPASTANPALAQLPRP